MAENPHPTSVAVLGSCISMDSFNSLFNPDWRLWYSFPFNTSQASLISIMSGPVDFDPVPDEGMAAYPKRCMADELSRGFLTTLVEQKTDFLVLDWFGDVHRGIVRAEEGPWLTDHSDRLAKTDWYRTMDAAGKFERLNSLSNRVRYLTLWCEA